MGALRGIRGSRFSVFLTGLLLWTGLGGTAALRAQYPQYLGKELDLILGQGFTWGEVKNYSDVFDSNHRFYDKVMEQAKHTVEIRNLLMSDPEIAPALKALGKNIKFRIYLLGGVSESAARELEQMGFEVFGRRYPDEFGSSQILVLRAG